MEKFTSTGIADAVGGSFVFAAPGTSGVFGGVEVASCATGVAGNASVYGHGSLDHGSVSGRGPVDAGSVVLGSGRDANTNAFRPSSGTALPMSLRRFAGIISPSRGSTRPEVVELV